MGIKIKSFNDTIRALVFENKGFLFSALFMQALYWFVYTPVFATPPIPKDMIIREVQVASLEKPELSEMVSANWETAKLTWTGCCDKKYYALKYTFPIKDKWLGDLGLIPNIGADNYHVFINGQVLRDYGQLHPVPTFHGMKKDLIRIPRIALKDFGNELVIISARWKNPYTDFVPFILGDYTQLNKVSAKRFWQLAEFQKFSILISGLITFFAFLVLPQTNNRRLVTWIAVLSLIWTLRSAYYFWFTFPFSPEWRLIYYFALTNGLALAWYGFIDSWTTKPWRQLQVWLTAIYICVMLMITVALMRGDSGGESGYDFADFLTIYVFTIPLIVLSTVRLILHVLRNREARHWELAAFLLCLTAIFVDIFKEVVFDRPSNHLGNVAIIFLLAFIAAIISRNVKIYESLGVFNEELKQTLFKRETEIKSKYEELQTVRRQRDIANERQRILRDMHDGIGGQLIALLSAAKSGNLKQKNLETTLSQSLTDLRLMIDSLDSVSSDFAVALGTFRTRIEPTLNTAGYTLHWNIADLPLGVILSPRKILNIYRILQECIANVIKHASATEITISVLPSPDTTPASYDIEIQDNGVGVKPRENVGYGLENMHRRADTIGAELSFSTGENGACVRLTGITPSSKFKG